MHWLYVHMSMLIVHIKLIFSHLFAGHLWPNVLRQKVSVR